MANRSALSIASYILIALVPFAIGIYVLIERKMIVGGRLSPGEVHTLDFPSYIMMACSFFLFSSLILISLIDLKYKTRIVELCFLLAIFLFGASIFI